MLIISSLHKKSNEVSIKSMSPPISFSFKGQATRHTIVKWSIKGHPSSVSSQFVLFSFMFCFCFCIYSTSTWATCTDLKKVGWSAQCIEQVPNLVAPAVLEAAYYLAFMSKLIPRYQSWTPASIFQFMEIMIGKVGQPRLLHLTRIVFFNFFCFFFLFFFFEQARGLVSSTFR